MKQLWAEPQHVSPDMSRHSFKESQDFNGLSDLAGSIYGFCGDVRGFFQFLG